MKKKSWICLAVVFFGLGIFIVMFLLALEELDKIHKRSVYRRVSTELIYTGLNQSLYHFLRKSGISDYNIVVAVEYFFIEMTRQATGEKIELSIPKWIVKEDIIYVNQLLCHIQAFSIDEELIRNSDSEEEALEWRQAYQRLMNLYHQRGYKKDKEAVEQLLKRDSYRSKTKIYFQPKSGPPPLFYCKIKKFLLISKYNYI